jgi:threonine/homoserine/homoserine lactone efflux protein
MKKAFGWLSLVMGVVLIGWVAFALITGYQPQSSTGRRRSPIGAIVLGVAMVGVGVKYKFLSSD